MVAEGTGTGKGTGTGTGSGVVGGKPSAWGA